MWTYTKLKNNLQLKQNIHYVHDKALVLLPNMIPYLMPQCATKTLLHLLVHRLCCVILFRKKKKKILRHTFELIIIYIYRTLINALSAHIILINLNMIFYTHVEHSPNQKQFT